MISSIAASAGMWHRQDGNSVRTVGQDIFRGLWKGRITWQEQIVLQRETSLGMTE